MTNAEQTALDARHAKARPLQLRAVVAERRGEYLTAADLFDQIAAIYAENGGAYVKAARRCRKFAAAQVK